jgi:hypothetical protein
MIGMVFLPLLAARMAGRNDAGDSRPVRVANDKNCPIDTSGGVLAILGGVPRIINGQVVGIRENRQGLSELNAVLGKVLGRFGFIPLKLHI